MYTLDSYERQGSLGAHKETWKILHKGCNNTSHGYRGCSVKFEPTIYSQIQSVVYRATLP